MLVVVVVVVLVVVVSRLGVKGSHVRIVRVVMVTNDLVTRSRASTTLIPNFCNIFSAILNLNYIRIVTKNIRTHTCPGIFH